MFADIEGAIAERLKAALPGISVMTAADLASVTEDRQPAPALHVVYQSYRVLETRPDGKAAAVEQTWLVVAVARDVRDIRAGAASRLAAALVAEQALPHLMGWVPPGAAGPLLLSTPPKPAYANGITYLPLAFSVKTTLTNRGAQ